MRPQLSSNDLAPKATTYLRDTQCEASLPRTGNTSCTQKKKESATIRSLWGSDLFRFRGTSWAKQTHERTWPHCSIRTVLLWSRWLTSSLVGREEEEGFVFFLVKKLSHDLGQGEILRFVETLLCITKLGLLWCRGRRCQITNRFSWSVLLSFEQRINMFSSIGGLISCDCLLLEDCKLAETPSRPFWWRLSAGTDTRETVQPRFGNA